MIESEDKADNAEDDERISMTVFYHAKKEGCDDDEAERVARAIGEVRYNSLSQRFKRWCMDRLKAIGIVVASLITGAAAIMAEELLILLKHLF